MVLVGSFTAIATGALPTVTCAVARVTGSKITTAFREESTAYTFPVRELMATALVLLSKPVEGASHCEVGAISPPRKMTPSGPRSILMRCIVVAVIGRSRWSHPAVQAEQP